jgi:hypothetical protein
LVFEVKFQAIDFGGVQVDKLDLLLAEILDLGLELNDLLGVQVLQLVARVLHLSFPLQELLSMDALQVGLLLCQFLDLGVKQDLSLLVHNLEIFNRAVCGLKLSLEREKRGGVLTFHQLNLFSEGFNLGLVINNNLFVLGLEIFGFGVEGCNEAFVLVDLGSVVALKVGEFSTNVLEEGLELSDVLLVQVLQFEQLIFLHRVLSLVIKNLFSVLFLQV